MATQIQWRKGTTAQHSTFTGALGEVTVDTDKDTLVVHDSSTVGGHPLAKAGANNDITSLSGITTALSVSQGGTGATTHTANNILVGSGSSAISSIAPGTSGNVLLSNGTTWTSASNPHTSKIQSITCTQTGGALNFHTQSMCSRFPLNHANDRCSGNSHGKRTNYSNCSIRRNARFCHNYCCKSDPCGD